MTTPVSAAAPSIAVPPVVAKSPPVASARPVTVAVTQMPPDDHLTDWVNIGVSGSVGLVAALLGAYIGYLLTKKSNQDTKDREEDEKNRFASFSMRHKLIKIYGTLNVVKDTYGEAKSKAEEEKAKGGIPHPAMYARGAFNDLSAVTFGDEELYRTGRLCPKEYINSIMLLDDHHNSKVGMLAKYAVAREKLDDLISGPVGEGGVRSVAWTKADYEKVQPTLVGLDMMIDAMLDKIDDDRRRTFEALEMLWVATSTKYKMGDIDVVGLDGKVKTIKGAPVEPSKK